MAVYLPTTGATAVFFPRPQVKTFSGAHFLCEAGPTTNQNSWGGFRVFLHFSCSFLTGKAS